MEPSSTESREERYARMSRELLDRLGKQWMDDLERDIWSDEPRKCDHDTQIRKNGKWRCHVCSRVIRGVDDAKRAAALERATDPLRRWCGKHDKPLMDAGGGPGAYSVCPDCYEGKPHLAH